MLGRNIGRYHVVAKLGEGGMGSVWKAQDATGRVVALKLLPQDMAHSDIARRRFLRGARAVAALDHPHIAPLYEIDEFRGELFLAGEFVDGETLSARVARGPVPVGEAIRIAAEAAGALAHAHARGVVHRDITPRNIMLDRSGRTRVIDFGLAFYAGAAPLTNSDAMVGTLHYMPPESLQGGRVDERGDVYSLGIVLYEMLTGSVPYPGDQAGVVVFRATQGNAPAPSRVVKGIPEVLDAAVLRAMAREVTERFSSAAELGAALAAIEVDAGAGGTMAADPAAAPDPTGPTRPIVVRLPHLKRVVIPPFRETVFGDGTEPMDQALAAGVADDLAAALARDPELQVVPAAALRPEDLSQGIVAAARRAGANLIIQGQVQRSPSAVRVSFSLLDAVERTLIRGDSIDGSATDWFRIEDQLLDRVTRALELRPPARRPGRLERPAAHERYLVAAGRLQRADHEASVDEAIGILESLLRTEGESAVVEALLAKACMQKHILTRDIAWVRRAEAACREAMRLDPHSSEALRNMAHVQILTSDSEGAAETLKQLIGLRDHDAEAFQWLSLAYERLARYPEAEEACRRAIELRPDYWGGFNRYGSFLYHQGRYEAAAAQWQRVVELTPDNAHGLLNLASARFALGELGDAERNYRCSLAVRSTATAHTGLGTVLFYQGRTADAERELIRATELRPRDSIMWGNLGDVQRWMPDRESESTSNLDRAIQLSRERLELDPNDGECWRRMALWLAKRGAIAEAEPALDRAWALASDPAATWVTACTVYLLGGRVDRAKQCFAMARARGWNRVELERDPELAPLRKEEIPDTADERSIP